MDNDLSFIPPVVRRSLGECKQHGALIGQHLWTLREFVRLDADEHVGFSSVARNAHDTRAALAVEDAFSGPAHTEGSIDLPEGRCGTTADRDFFEESLGVIREGDELSVG